MIFTVAAALISRLRSIGVTLVAAVVIGLVDLILFCDVELVTVPTKTAIGLLASQDKHTNAILHVTC